VESSGGKEGPKAPGSKDSPGSGEPVTTEIEAAKPEDQKEAKSKDPSEDLWFRLSTRLKAVGYWLREKLQAAGRDLGAAGKRLGDLWQKSPIWGRVAIAAGATLLFLVLLIRVVPVGPCQLSVKECAPSEKSFELVPADALLYAHLTIDEGSDQFERSGEAFERLSDLRTILAAEVPGALPTPSGTPIDISEDVLPWAERDLALTLLPGPGKGSLPAFVAGVEDQAGAEAFLARVAPAGNVKTVKVGDEEMSLYPEGFAAALVQDSLVFGQEPAVRASINAASGDAPALEGSPEEQTVREELPESRFAELYMSRSGVQRLLAGRAGPATQLETFVDYGATDGLAAAAVAKEDGIELELVSSLNPQLLKQNPSFFSGLPTFEPTLTAEAGQRSIAYAGVGEVGPTLSELLDRTAGGGGLAGSLRGLSDRLRAEAGVDPLSELLPALGGQAALVAEPTDGVPFASLIVDGVDTDQAAQALAKLQRPLLRALGGGAQVPRFEEQEIDGVPVRSVQASPTVNLAYAVFDDKLVISTDPAGVEQVLGEGGLEDSEPFQRATDELSDEVSALVFLNLDELFGQVTRTDLVEDPFFANLSVLFENATSAALAVNGDDEEIRSELFLALD
jgi:Protein of unknown function (DUF3352)